MNQFASRQNRGFTLKEILVVVAIIAILSSVVIVNVAQVKKKSRDHERRTEIGQILVAFRLYKDSYGTYQIPNTGGSSNGSGWFTYPGPFSGYVNSIASGLIAEKLIPAPIEDPLVPPGNLGSPSQRPYMVYPASGNFANGICIFAHLENPSSEDTQTFTDALTAAATKTTIQTNWGMNYAQCHT